MLPSRLSARGGPGGDWERMLEGLRFGARQGIPHLTRWAPATSEAGGRTEAIGRKTDIADGMSEAEGRPDVPQAWPELRFLAKIRH